MDGDCRIFDEVLHLLTYSEKSFLLTNNLQIKSSKVLVSVQMNVLHDLLRVKEETSIQTEEVIAFNFAPSLYPIKQYSQFKTSYSIDGYSLFLFYKEARGYVFMQENHDPQDLDLQTVFSTFPSKNSAFCEYDYRNRESNMKFYLDWT